MRSLHRRVARVAAPLGRCPIIAAMGVPTSPFSRLGPAGAAPLRWATGWWRIVFFGACILVLAEAMAAATPVVALRATGVNDVLQDGLTGQLLAAGSSAAEFGAVLAAALADEVRLARWSRNAALAARALSRQKSAARLGELYTRILAGSPHKTAIDMLDGAILAIKAEWELLQQKTAAAINSLVEDGE